MNINALESAVVNDKVENVDKPGAEAEVEMYVIGWSSSTGDADWGIRPLVAVESEPPMSYNICYYENEEVDKLLYDALSTADETKRAEFYAQAQDILRLSIKFCSLCLISCAESIVKKFIYLFVLIITDVIAHRRLRLNSN